MTLKGTLHQTSRLSGFLYNIECLEHACCKSISVSFNQGSTRNCSPNFLAVRLYLQYSLPWTYLLQIKKRYISPSGATNDACRFLKITLRWSQASYWRRAATFSALIVTQILSNLSELSTVGGRIQSHTQAHCLLLLYLIHFLPVPPPPSLHLPIHPPSLCLEPHPCTPYQLFIRGLFPLSHAPCPCTAYGLLLLCLVVSISHFYVTHQASPI